MRGIVCAAVSACLLTLVPASAQAEGSGTSAYAGVDVSPHESAHGSASAQAAAPEAGCSITGGEASLSVSYIRNPVPFGRVDAAVLVGNAHTELEGSGCFAVTGTFNEYPCVPNGPTSCVASMGATTVTLFTSIPIVVTITASGLTSAGQLVQDAASCSMTFQAFAPEPSCELT
jgi:hypothetical protein